MGLKLILRCAVAGLSLLTMAACQTRIVPAPNQASTVVAAPGAAATTNAPPTNGVPRYTLRAEQTWQLNLPGGERFDASGLCLLPKGDLLTVNDVSPGLHRIQFRAGTNAADLIRLPDCFTATQIATFAKDKVGRWDCEGIARDEQGRLYVCEEANRWIMRFDPRTKTLERLAIDWTPVKQYFHPTDLNASFEGVAVGGGKLFVANERQAGRIIVVDLKTLQVVDDFVVRPTFSFALDIHYSDLCWHDGALYALLRESRCVLKVDPKRKALVAEYNYDAMERAPEVAYENRYPTGTMEGLAVDRDFFWLVTDNNGRGRKKYPDDTRPTLFKCRRPDAGK